MRTSEMTRRAFAGAAAAAGLLRGGDGWVDLFDGRSLDGWRAGENRQSWKVVAGRLAGDGPRSHLFYSGPVRGASFRNFELEVEALAGPGCNSGVYFHTAYQESGWPQKGFEVQINNTAAGEGDYRERKKTGSLYGVRNVYKQLVPDSDWFRLHIAVRGKNVQVRLNGTLLVDYTEPEPPFVAPGGERERFLDRGTFALQCHDPGSKVLFRRIRARPLPDDLRSPLAAPPADEAFRQILIFGSQNIPMLDLHVHLKAGFTLEQALARSRRDGIQYGVAANCGKGFPIHDDQGAQLFAESLAGQPVFIGMQAEGREWTRMFSRQTVELFDYVFTDSMTWTDNRGRRLRLWIPEEVGTIPCAEDFVDLLVARTVEILEREPVDVYVNPTFLPESIASQAETLWTEERMNKIVRAAARNGVAIEINNRYRLPSLRFLRMAREEGVKFAFGTNNAGPEDLGRCEYGLEVTGKLNLGWQDFFVPGAWGPRAVERKGGALASSRRASLAPA